MQDNVFTFCCQAHRFLGMQALKDAHTQTRDEMEALYLRRTNAGYCSWCGNQVKEGRCNHEETRHE
jgi:hypothetical protein